MSFDIDVDHEINAAARAVGGRTNAERIPRCFLPITGELRLGGTYQLEGNAAE